MSNTNGSDKSQYYKHLKLNIMKKNTQANLESQLDETVKHLIESSDKNCLLYTSRCV